MRVRGCETKPSPCGIPCPSACCAFRLTASTLPRSRSALSGAQLLDGGRAAAERSGLFRPLEVVPAVDPFPVFELAVVLLTLVGQQAYWCGSPLRPIDCLRDPSLAKLWPHLAIAAPDHDA